jgi:hypothetical protein
MHDKKNTRYFSTSVYSDKKLGMPKLRWLDCFENVMKWMGVKRWRKKGGERSAGVSS